MRSTPSNSDPGGRLLVSGREAARMLSICERSLWSMSQRGEVPSVRLGSRRLYSVEALRQWIGRRLASQSDAEPAPGGAA